MSKDKFSVLIEELHTDLIIFIDDDFTPITVPGEILYFIISLNEIDYNQLCDRINLFNKEIVSLLNKFKSSFFEQEITEEDKPWYLAGELLNRLKDKDLPELHDSAKSIITLIDYNISELDNQLAEIVMSYGLVPVSGAVTCYKPFFDVVKKNGNSMFVRVYRSLEGDSFNNFVDEIQYLLGQTKNKYFLLIVDKILADNHDGTTIINDLKARKLQNTFFSILFTSQAESQSNSVDFQHFQIQKPQSEGDNTATVEKLSNGLALCAYATFFQNLFELKVSALRKANNIVLNSGKTNMLYLADMANAEGDTVFHTINGWLDLLVQKKINDELSVESGDTLDFDFIVGLTSLINSNFLSDSYEQIGEEFKSELTQLNSFELFDQAINKMYSPPSPGDIYIIENNIFILAGQDCDLIIRDGGKEICRKEKLAELIQCTFIDIPLNDKKKEDEKSLTLNYFQYKESYGSIKISFNKRSFYDFRILDLCSLNKEGESSFNSDVPLSELAIKALPSMWLKYQPRLYKELNDKVKVFNFISENEIDNNILNADSSFSLKISNESSLTKFPVFRVARLKGQFKEYFLQKYWEYKTRKGLNTISLFNRQPIKINSIKYGFNGALNEITDKPEAWIQLSGKRERNKNLNKLPLILSIKAFFSFFQDPFKQHFISITGNEIVLEENEVIEKQSLILFRKNISENGLDLEIIFPYKNLITNAFFNHKNKIKITDIFSPDFMDKHSISEATTYSTIIKEEVKEFSLCNNQKNNKISIDHLVNGITISSANIEVKLDITTGELSHKIISNEPLSE